MRDTCKDETRKVGLWDRLLSTTKGVLDARSGYRGTT